MILRMARHYTRARLTNEQREDVSLLVNAGVRYAVLAKTYDISMDVVHMISQYRARWMAPEAIAKTPGQKFVYAQRAYHASDHKNDAHLRKLIEQEVFLPIAGDAAAAAVIPAPEETLLSDILDRCLLPGKHTNGTLAERALDELVSTIKSGALYADPQTAVQRITPAVTVHAHAQARRSVKLCRSFIPDGLDLVLAALPFEDQEMVRLKYGVGYPQYDMVEIGSVFGMTKQAVHVHVAAALKALRPLVKRHLPLCGAPYHKKKAK